MTQTQYRGGRWIAVLLIAILIAGNVVAGLGREGFSRESMEWIVLSQVTLVGMAQLKTSLASLWLAWGVRWLPVRILALCFTVYLCADEYYSMFPDTDPTRFPLLLLAIWGIYSLVLVVCATAMRVAGFRLQRFTPGELNGAAPPVRSFVANDVTFSLRALLAWTAGIAVLSALVRFALVYEPWQEFMSEIVTNVPESLASALRFSISHVVPLTLGWAILTAHRLAPRLAIAFVASVSTSLKSYLVGGAPDLIDICMDAGFVCLLAVALFVFRFAGYRLLWRTMRAAESVRT